MMHGQANIKFMDKKWKIQFRNCNQDCWAPHPDLLFRLLMIVFPLCATPHVLSLRKSVFHINVRTVFTKRAKQKWNEGIHLALSFRHSLMHSVSNPIEWRFSLCIICVLLCHGTSFQVNIASSSSYVVLGLHNPWKIKRLCSLALVFPANDICCARSSGDLKSTIHFTAFYSGFSSFAAT